MALDGRLMAVPLRLRRNDEAIEPGEPVPLFQTRVGADPAAMQNGNFLSYVAAPDGSRFLMSMFLDEIQGAPITVVLNWRPK